MLTQRPHRQVVIELHYLPCLDYIAGLLQAENVWLEAHEQYQKQSYRNRCYIRSSQRIEVLTVPIQKNARHAAIRDVRIENGQPWQRTHWRSLTTAYARAPFFEDYAPFLKPEFERAYTFLFDWNLTLLTICLNLLHPKTPMPAIGLTKCYEPDLGLEFMDARNRLQPPFDTPTRVFNTDRPYGQNFGTDFVPNLSILDLLFCQGPSAPDFVKPQQQSLSQGRVSPRQPA